MLKGGKFELPFVWRKGSKSDNANETSTPHNEILQSHTNKRSPKRLGPGNEGGTAKIAVTEENYFSYSNKQYSALFRQ